REEERRDEEERSQPAGELRELPHAEAVERDGERRNEGEEEERAEVVAELRGALDGDAADGDRRRRRHAAQKLRGAEEDAAGEEEGGEPEEGVGDAPRVAVRHHAAQCKRTVILSAAKDLKMRRPRIRRSFAVSAAQDDGV